MPPSRSTAARSAQRRRTHTMTRRAAPEPVAPTAPTATTSHPDPDEMHGDSDRRRPTPSWPSTAGLVICALGLVDAAYLTYAHYTSAANLACSTSGTFNCTAVTTSKYSHVLGFPVSVLGLLFFAGMLPLMLPAAWRSTNRPLRTARVAATVVGIGMVLWLVYAEVVKLRALCEYCTGVHLLTFALFIVVSLGTIATSPDPE